MNLPCVSARWPGPVFLLVAAVFALSTGTGSAAVGLLTSRAAITNDFTGPITLTITGLTNTQTVIVERFTDFNGNGAVDGTDFLVHRFTVTDGTRPLIGGVRNSNVPGDEDATVNGEVRVDLPFPSLDPIFGRASGKFLFRVSDAGASFTPAIRTLTVAQKVLLQGARGRLTALTGGAALPNAFVALLKGEHEVVDTTVSDANGDFTLYSPAGDYSVVPVAGGFVANFNSGPVAVVANQFVTNNLPLPSATLTLSGRVSDAATGDGVGGVFVSAEDSSSNFIGAFTMANGNYTLGALAGNWSLSLLEFQAAELGFVSPGNDLATNVVGSASGLNFPLSKATALIHGTVRDNLNNLIFGLGISGNGSNNIYRGSGRTAPGTGTYSLGVLPGSVNVSPDSDDLNRLNLIGTGSNVTVNAGQALQVNLTMLIATARLRGQITDGSEPISDIEIVLQPVPLDPSGAGSVYRRTDGNGNFDLGVRAGTWNLNLECVRAQAANLVGVTSFNFTVVDGVDQNGLVLAFPRSTATITGTVKDAQNNPIAGVQLDASSSTNLVGCVPTDANGAFTLKVLNNRTWQVSVRTNDLNFRGFNGVAAQNVTLPGGGPANFVALLPTGVRIDTGSLPAATQGLSYNTTLAASGGQSPYSWSISSGFLPSGLVLSPGGQLSGTPGENGSFVVFFRVQDATNGSATAGFPLNVSVGTFARPLMTNAPGAGPGELRVDLAVVGGQTYTLEGSDDLKQWRGIFTFVAPGASFQLSELADRARFAQRVYRLRLGRVFSPEFHLNFFAFGGAFGAALTPPTTFPVPLSGFAASFSTINDHAPPVPGNVRFTGPAGSGLTNSPADATNSRVQLDGSRYQSTNVFNPIHPPAGTWTVNHHGTNHTFVLPDAQATNRLVILLPTVTLNSGNLQSVAWSYRNATTGATLSLPPVFITDVQLQVDVIGQGRVYDSPRLAPGSTNHTIPATINWNNVSKLFLVYNDSLGNHYVNIFDRAPPPQ